jgi:hypothetical protein
MPFSFKKHKAATGLMAVGHSHQSVTIKFKKKKVGEIQAPNWTSKDLKWTVAFTVKDKEATNPNCDWKWFRIKEKFDTEEAARKWCKDNEARIHALGLHSEDPDDEE